MPIGLHTVLYNQWGNLETTGTGKYFMALPINFKVPFQAVATWNNPDDAANGTAVQYAISCSATAITIGQKSGWAIGFRWISIGM